MAENTAAGEDIGAPVVATAGSGAVTYSLGGTDAASFDIVAATGHKVVWRLGNSNLSDEQWESRDLGPPPLGIVNDPLGEFCGQPASSGSSFGCWDLPRDRQEVHPCRRPTRAPGCGIIYEQRSAREDMFAELFSGQSR